MGDNSLGLAALRSLQEELNTRKTNAMICEVSKYVEEANSALNKSLLAYLETAESASEMYMNVKTEEKHARSHHDSKTAMENRPLQQVHIQKITGLKQQIVT